LVAHRDVRSVLFLEPSEKLSRARHVFIATIARQSCRDHTLTLNVVVSLGHMPFGLRQLR
jgi:hypothetical protein